ncbi:general secretion pathway protein GspB [Desulfurivibrio sp. D14AmB]|uniref:general secretion pathway protein GspB n=1 Tax=Desulfurivibrio sp. D14AmB TaxID=3374370 RepID=UPI00376EDB07
MSYILEALKKSERQRRLGAVPRLDTPQEPPSRSPAASRPGWLRPLLLLNLLLVVALLAYLLLPVGSGREQPGPLLEALEEKQLPLPAQPAESATPQPRPEEGPLAPAAATSEPQPQPQQEPAPLPLPELSPPALVGPPPRWSELPAGLRQQVTPPSLEVHVYSENPARRFVMIRGRQYREGDTLPDQLRLDQITPQGVVLSWHGEPFRLEH